MDDLALKESQQEIESAYVAFQKELSSIRAGRANPALIENITVDAYGAKMKLVEVGTIAVPQPSLLTVQVWDVSLIGAVLKALQVANLGLNPSAEGNLIRLPIPPLSNDRRQELIKLLHQKMENARIEIRQVRQDSRQDWTKQKETGEIGEDELLRKEKILQEQIDKAMEKIEELGKTKEEELLEI